MEFESVPVGFGKALARNEAATNAYAMMTEEQKNEILKKAYRTKSKRRMRKLVDEIAQDAMM